MKLLLVSHGYPPYGVAGVERLSAQTAEALTARGHAVTVLTRRPNETPRTLTLVRDRRTNVPVVSIVGAGSTFGRFPGHEGAMERVFERMLAELSPDVVLISHLLHHSPGYVEIAHRWGIPVVLELHDFYVVCPRAHLQRTDGELCEGPEGGAACAAHCFADQPAATARWSLRAQSFAAAVRDADAVVCPSSYVADALASRRGEGATIRVVGNGVSALGPVLRGEPDDAGPLRLASIGVTVEHKGFHVVIAALRKAALPAARYTVLGVPARPQAWELREAAEQVPGLQLRLFGGFEPHMLPVLLADADVLVVPSLVAETYSIVVREAFACGVPVIASRIGALPDAIRPGENGWLFAPGDAAELAVLLQRLDADRTLARRLAAGIRADDVVPAAERSATIEQLLAEIVAAGSNAAPTSDGAPRILRDALAAELASDC